MITEDNVKGLLLTVGAVQVSEAEDISGATLDVAVCATADESSLASREVGRGCSDKGAANEGGNDGRGEHFEGRYEVGRFVWKKSVDVFV